MYTCLAGWVLQEFSQELRTLWNFNQALISFLQTLSVIAERRKCNTNGKLKRMYSSRNIKLYLVSLKVGHFLTYDTTINKRPNSWFYPNLRKYCFIWIEKYLFHPNWRKYWFYLNWRKNGWDWCCLSTFAWNVVARNLSCQFLKMFSLEKEKMRRRMVMVNNQMIFIIW